MSTMETVAPMTTAVMPEMMMMRKVNRWVLFSRKVMIRDVIR